MSKPYIPVSTSLVELDCQKAFSALEQKQALYAYNFAKASWAGAKICFFERSYESPAILYLILKGFEKGARATVDAVKEKFDDNALQQLLIYLAAVIDNTGNYKSFGDTKFIPECSEEVFKQFFLATPYWSAHQEDFEKIYSRIGKLIFNAESPYGHIDFSDKHGTSGYYSGNVTSADAEKVKEITISKGIKSENNRLTKQSNTEFTVKVAAIEAREEVIEQNGLKVTLKYGEFAPFLRDLNKYLSEAQKHSANEHQSKMIGQYLEHFKTGDMAKHVESQKHWIQDKGPIIETNIGFIESYLDPLKIRSEFEGFVAVVNQEESQILNKLVEGAETTLKYLPWGQQFECDEFKKPDFTSLQVLAFAASGIPIGINIPNYDEIRQNFGFKNVNLGNAYGKPTLQTLQYIAENEKQTYLKYHGSSLFVLVAIHELLGHGSGKLYDKVPDFPSPLDGQEIKTCYKANQTWHSVFGEIASTYQECKADSVGIFLACFQDVQQTLLPKYNKEERWQVVYICWYDLLMQAIRGLEYYDVKHKKWMQAHIGARFAIFSVLKQAGGVFQLKQVQKDGKPNLEIIINRENIATKGKDAIGKFLKHLQIYKSTADFERGNKYFQQYLKVDEQMLKYRDFVIENKRPRRLTVQPDVQLQGDKVQYVKFQNSACGHIDSCLAHYSEHPEDIIEEWEKNNQEFTY